MKKKLKLKKYETGGGTGDDKSKKNKTTLPPIYVDSKDDPRYKAYSDSLSLYNGSKAAYNEEDLKTLMREQDNWFNMMISPYTTTKERSSLHKPTIDDFLTYEEQIGENSRSSADVIYKPTLYLSNNSIKYKDPAKRYLNMDITRKNMGDSQATLNFAMNKANSPIKPHYIQAYGEGAYEVFYKKPVQPVRIMPYMTLDNFTVTTSKPSTFGEVNPLPEAGIDTAKKAYAKLKGPVTNYTSGVMPTFMIPSTGSSIPDARDLYQWDYDMKKYAMTKIVAPDEGRHVYDAIYKSSLDSLNSELNNSNYGNKKRNPFTMQSGGWLNKYN